MNFNRHMSPKYPFMVYYMKDVRFFCPFYILHAIKFVFDTKRNSKEFLTPKKPFYTEFISHDVYCIRFESYFYVIPLWRSIKVSKNLWE